MPAMILDDDEIKASANSYTVADVLSYLAVVSRRMPSLMANHRNLHPIELAIRLLRDVAILHGYNDESKDGGGGGGSCCCCKEQEEEDNNGWRNPQQTDVLVHRIRINDPKLTKLALRKIRVIHRGKQASSFRGFTETSIQRATEALHTNHTIRSVSCRYDDGAFPGRLPRLLRCCESCDDEEESSSSGEEPTYGENDHSNNHLRAATTATTMRRHHRKTKLQEHRFFEACVRLPSLESISLTGGNRWRVSHLVTMLEQAKNLKQLTVRDVVVKSSSELNGLKRLLVGGCAATTPCTSGRRTHAPIELEAIELAVEDQTHRDDEYWSAATAMDVHESPFDGLLEALVASPNIKEIKLSKSILSRFRLRPIHDVSTRTLLKLARCQSLSKLVLSGISVEQGGVEAMCEALIQNNGHLTRLEFYGCAFNHTVGQSGWNAMFRLIRHDPTIQICASSLVYLQQWQQPTTTTTSADNDTDIRAEGERNPGRTPPNREDDEPRDPLSVFVKRPRNDFCFSLRDKDGARKHFQNRDLDVRYKLREAGFFGLLRAKHQAKSGDWINVMARVGDDSIALFSVLREIPSLCDVVQNDDDDDEVEPSSPLAAPPPASISTQHHGRERRSNRRSNRRTKRRKVSPISTHCGNSSQRRTGIAV